MHETIANKIFYDIDKNKKGHISFEEFKSF